MNPGRQPTSECEQHRNIISGQLRGASAACSVGAKRCWTALSACRAGLSAGQRTDWHLSLPWTIRKPLSLIKILRVPVEPEVQHLLNSHHRSGRTLNDRFVAHCFSFDTLLFAPSAILSPQKVHVGRHQSPHKHRRYGLARHAAAGWSGIPNPDT